MDKIVEHAFNEWERYLGFVGISGVKLNIEISPKMFLETNFSLNGVEFDPIFDDAFHVEITSGSGTIWTTNLRSALLAVYESLRRLGFLFASPIPEEEVYPTTLIKEEINLSFTRYAAHRHRGVDVCAPREITSLKNYIRWLPKIGCNSIFFEGWSGHLSYQSWYCHEENEFLPQDESYDLGKGLQYDKECFELAKDLGLICHGMGHGWNVATFSNDVYNDMFPTENTVIDYEKIALVNGERKLPNGILRCANLCLSNQTVKEKLVDLVVNYAKEHRYIDVLHFWLGDSLNNVCECDECLKTSISDQYVELLNEIDRRLTASGCNVKIVFLLYQDTLWKPLKNRIVSNRFILQFSPISRDYNSSFLDCLDEKKSFKKSYIRNQVESPFYGQEFCAYLKDWQNVYKGDAFAFDYQNYYASRYDVSNLFVAELIVKDIKAYKRLGLNGLISCQFYRNAFPNGFATYAMARALLDEDFDFEREKNIYFSACYGAKKTEIEQYLIKVKKGIPLSYYQWFGENENVRSIQQKPKICIKKLQDILCLTQKVRESICAWSPCLSLQKNNKKLLQYYFSVIDILVEIIKKKEQSSTKKEMLSLCETLRMELSKAEEFLLPYCSIDHILQAMHWLIVNEP